MAKEAHNRMEVQSERISPKQVVLTVDLYSDLADTAFLTLMKPSPRQRPWKTGTCRSNSPSPMSRAGSTCTR